MPKKLNPEPYDEIKKMETMAVLAAQSGNYLATSKITGVPRTTIVYWSKQQNRTAKLYQTYQETLPSMVADRVADKVVAISADWIPQAIEVIGLYTNRLKEPGVVAKTDAKDAAFVIKTLWDKIRDLMGQGPKTTVTVTDEYEIEIPADLKANLGDLYVERPSAEGSVAILKEAVGQQDDD